ncbi:MAG: T9SS type A sorting domain-containing protein [Ignavibacteria bacterium]|nr:T9SS type A sorting domain-containing protein [Ignavibacteria bacterium]
MKRKILFTLFSILTLLVQTTAFAGNIDLKFYSSETGVSVIPEKLIIYNTSTGQDIITPQALQSNNYSVSLAEGTYSITVFKSGYQSSQTSFDIKANAINCSIFLDPLAVSTKLNTLRIKSLLKPDAALLLGYVVDENTGAPLGNTTIKDASLRVLGTTDADGYFELYFPANCDKRTLVTLNFEKTPYSTKIYKDFEITPNTDFIFTVRLKQGSDNFSLNTLPHDSRCSDCTPQTLFPDMAVTGFVVPLNIRVGRNCTGTNCTTVEVYSLQTYLKYVLPAEIYACWGNLSGGMNSLQACAVAARSYAVYYVYNPINSNYDICDNTYCQFMGSVTSTNTSSAIDNTFGYILTNSSGVVRSEYSAENNNKGCGNGYSGTGSSWPCISDPVCTGFSPNGHGRGLCQWGTVRWATGRVISTSSPCGQGTAHSYGTKTWQQILAHYYNVSPQNWQVTLGTTAVINTSSPVPVNSNPCAQITINNNVTSSGSASLMIGASIAPAGTTNWISDPAGDVKRNFTSGTANYSRTFNIPCNTAPGVYDILTALWYDKNNNNTIDGSDFVVSSKLTTGALTISPLGVTILSTEIPDKFALEPNYPNPFNPVTKINFDIPNQSNAKIIIYDLLGREITTLVNEQLKPGSYSVDWDGTGFASGVYFYSLITEGFVETNRMVLVK